MELVCRFRISPLFAGPSSSRKRGLEGDFRPREGLRYRAITLGSLVTCSKSCGIYVPWRGPTYEVSARSDLVRARRPAGFSTAASIS